MTRPAFQETFHHIAAVANANGLLANVTGHAGIAIQIVGAFGTGTITFEGSLDGTNWLATVATNVTTGASATTATAAGIYRADVAGLQFFRARLSGANASTNLNVRSMAVQGARDRRVIVDNAADITVGAVQIDQTTPGANNVVLTGSIQTLVSAPATGQKTVTATAAELFAGVSVRANRRRLRIKNEDPFLRLRIGPSAVTQQNGFPVEPFSTVEFDFDPATPVVIFGTSEGAALTVSVWEE